MKILVGRYTKPLIMHLALLIQSAWIWIVFIRYNYNFIPQKSFDALISGVAPMPYARRLLLPFISQMMESLIPANGRIIFEIGYLQLKELATTAGAHPSGLDSHFPIAHFWGLFFILIAIYFAALIFKRLCRRLGFSETTVSLSPFLFLAGIPLLMNPAYANYYYDMPSLFFSVLILYSLISAHALLLFFAMAFAILNKETFILAVPLIIHRGYKEERRQYILMGLALIGVWATIQFALVGGATKLEFHLYDLNLKILALGYQLPQLLSGLFLGWAVFYQWKDKPEIIRYWFVLFLLIFFPSQLFWGVLNELRIYYEVYPAALLLIFFTFERLLIKINKC